MKNILILNCLALAFGLSSASPTPEDGPLCTATQVNQASFRHSNDPTKYWACLGLSRRAELMSCPSSMAFDDATGQCVDWEHWRWIMPYEEFIASRVGSSYTPGSDGRPGCKTDEELSVVYWRNNNDPTKYWKCEKKNEPGVEISCPEGYAYAGHVKICITLERWEWSAPFDPPSFP